MQQDEHLRRVIDQINTELGPDSTRSNPPRDDPPSRKSGRSSLRWLLVAGLAIGVAVLLGTQDTDDERPVTPNIRSGASSSPRELETPAATSDEPSRRALSDPPATSSPTLQQRPRVHVDELAALARLRDTLASSRPPPSRPTFDAPTVPASHGLLQRPENPSRATLTIKTSTGSNYYVKLEDELGRIVLTAYVTGGRDLTTNVPVGRFTMKYAVGETWYGTEYLFGPGERTRTWKADELFEFDETHEQTWGGSTEISYSVVTVELILQVAGNLETQPIPREAF